MDLSYLQRTCYFFPSKDNTFNNGEQLAIYVHFDDNQTDLARSPTIDFGITQLTLNKVNKPKTVDHGSIATGQ